MTAPVAMPPHMVLMQQVTAYWHAQAISTAARLGIADELAKGARTPAEVAKALGLQADPTARLLRGLASIGYAAAQGDRYGMTPMLELLRKDVPGSMRDMTIMMGLPGHWRGWGSLADAVKTGESGFRCAYGQGFFEYLPGHPDEAKAFHGAMTNLSNMASQAVAGALDFGRFKKVCDVGGGQGFLLAAILDKHPSVQGVLFDLPTTLQGHAAPHARCTVEQGDFFAGVPAGCDAYLTKHILHDWDDERCVTILKHCREAMPVGGTMLVVEMPILGTGGFDMAVWMDLNMLAMTEGGRERTEAEFKALFERAGLAYVGMHPVPQQPYAIFEATRRA